MKKIIILILISASSLAWAGDKVGNGGGLWACWNQTTLNQGVLVDLYEAQEEFGLDLIKSKETDPFKMVEERRQFVKTHLSNYFPSWDKYLNEILSKMRFVNSELVAVDDSLYRIIPPATTCLNSWTYTQFANYTHLNQILIRNDLWQSPQVKTLDKAALIWHEAIYTWLRDYEADINSVRTRQIVGLLFSTLAPLEIKSRIEKIIQNYQDPEMQKWSCMMQNNLSNIFYMSYGESDFETRLQVIEQCQSQPMSFHCAEESIKCAEMTEKTAQYICVNHNGLTNKNFSGRGRNELEAEYMALQNCRNFDNYKNHCESHVFCKMKK